MNYGTILVAAATLFTTAYAALVVPAAAASQVVSEQPGVRRSKDIEDLLAADRAYSAASAKTDVVTGLTAMFTADITMPLPGAVWANGIAEATHGLQSNADNARSHAEWTPIRAGVSADGHQGFTFGFMTVRKPDNTTIAMKYMSYWVKGADGWRVAAFKRARRPDSTVTMTVMSPSMPAQSVSVSKKTKTLQANVVSLKKAEQNFSNEANKSGLGAAFALMGTSDAVNMGGGAGYIVGANAIAAFVSGPTPASGSPYVWNADKVIVASSGDLGVTFGMIRETANPTAPGTPFFTIWRRTSANAPWRYIAE